jgi:hypothetical protein
MTHFVYMEADIWDPKKNPSSQVARNQESTKSKKGKIYSSERMTYGTQFAASASKVPRRQGIQRKSQVGRN